LPVQRPGHPAADEEFPAMGEGVDAVTQPGWDRYQVRQTRVKTSRNRRKSAKASASR